MGRGVEGDVALEPRMLGSARQLEKGKRGIRLFTVPGYGSHVHSEGCLVYPPSARPLPFPPVRQLLARHLAAAVASLGRLAGSMVELLAARRLRGA